MASDLNPNMSAAAAAACMSAGGRVWWWAVSRSRTPTTRCRAGAYANGITPVCVGGRWTSVDVAVWATGWCRRATTDGSAHTRGRQDQPNDKDPWAWVSADTVPTTGCNPWVLAIALRPSSRQSTDTGGFGPMRSCRSARRLAALQQLKRSMRQKRNGLGLCAATGPCNPRATHTDGPMTERRLRVQVALAQPPGIDDGCLVSAVILGFLASSPWAQWIRRAFRTRGRDWP